jgi:hypothetical protein
VFRSVKIAMGRDSLHSAERQKEHRAIIDAIARHDPVEAEATARHHAQAWRQSVLVSRVTPDRTWQAQRGATQIVATRALGGGGEEYGKPQGGRGGLARANRRPGRCRPNHEPDLVQAEGGAAARDHATVARHRPG